MCIASHFVIQDSVLKKQISSRRDYMWSKAEYHPSNANTITFLQPDSSYGFGTNDQETNEVIMPECAFNEPLTRSVVARMQTEVCRLRAMNITCNEEREIPDDLPNSCPHYRKFGIFFENSFLWQMSLFIQVYDFSLPNHFKRIWDK